MKTFLCTFTPLQILHLISTPLDENRYYFSVVWTQKNWFQTTPQPYLKTTGLTERIPVVNRPYGPLFPLLPWNWKCAFSKPKTLHRQCWESVSTHVFPLDEHQIIWYRSSTVAWYNNGLSIQSSHAFCAPNCNTKGNRLLLLLKIYCTITRPTEQRNNLDCLVQCGKINWVMCALNYLEYCYGVLVHIKPPMV